jgi:dihydrofolate synthase/folylpolyglutamate synthase
MNLQQWCHYLENLHLSAQYLEPKRIHEVAKRLALPSPGCPVISVGGTNGKGSVVTLLENIYHTQAYCVAAFTSPYLLSFNEQFRVNKQHASDAELCTYFDAIESAKGDVLLTFFEYKTLAALLHFARAKPDVMILEVGLGGRLDAVNMLDADVAVISSISLDHCDWLGHTRELIAKEKAGIFREKQKIICGDPHPPVILKQIAQELGAQWYCRNEHFRLEESQPKSSLLPDNVATAMMVVKVLGLPVSSAVLNEGIEQAQLLGRQQVIQQRPLVIVDVAHNEDSVVRLADFVKQQSCKKIKAVFSVLKTKDVAAIIQSIESLIDEWHIAPIDHRLAMPAESIVSFIRTPAVYQYPSIADAYDAALAAAQEDDAIIVFGSFHVVGEVCR